MTPTPGTIEDTSAPASSLSLEELSDNTYVMELWREHGGSRHGPRVETVTMPLARFAGFCAALILAYPQKRSGTLTTDTSRAAVVEECARRLNAWQELAHAQSEALALLSPHGQTTHRVDAAMERIRALTAAPAAATGGQWERWYLGAQNDGLYIINAPPRPSNDDQWHDRPNGPTLAISVHGLSDAKAREIVDAHNAALAAPPAQAAATVSEAKVEAAARALARRAAVLRNDTWNPHYLIPDGRLQRIEDVEWHLHRNAARCALEAAARERAFVQGVPQKTDPPRKIEWDDKVQSTEDAVTAFHAVRQGVARYIEAPVQGAEAQPVAPEPGSVQAVVAAATRQAEQENWFLRETLKRRAAPPDAPGPDIEAARREEREPLEQFIERVVSKWKGINGGIYAVRGMSIDLAAAIRALAGGVR